VFCAKRKQLRSAWGVLLLHVCSCTWMLHIDQTLVFVQPDVSKTYFASASSFQINTSWSLGVLLGDVCTCWSLILVIISLGVQLRSFSWKLSGRIARSRRIFPCSATVQEILLLGSTTLLPRSTWEIVCPRACCCWITILAQFSVSNFQNSNARLNNSSTTVLCWS
jgi:hypothetical protein